MTRASWRRATTSTILEEQWREFWVDSGKPELKNADAAFIGFCKRRHEPPRWVGIRTMTELVSGPKRLFGKASAGSFETGRTPFLQERPRPLPCANCVVWRRF